MNDAPDDLDGSYPSPAIEGAGVAESVTNPVRQKSFNFAMMTVELCRELQADREYVISKQLMKSGTSVGANIEEAISAESRKDFLHKLNLALKEARESHYWLRLLVATNTQVTADLQSHLMAADELIRLLVSITRTLSRG
jgi:four helix bundle protein